MMDQANLMDLERFRGVVAIQQAISQARGHLSTVMDAIVDENSVMPQSNGMALSEQMHRSLGDGR